MRFLVLFLFSTVVSSAYPGEEGLSLKDDEALVVELEDLGYLYAGAEGNGSVVDFQPYLTVWGPDCKQPKRFYFGPPVSITDGETVSNHLPAFYVSGKNLNQASAQCGTEKVFTLFGLRKFDNNRAHAFGSSQFTEGDWHRVGMQSVTEESLGRRKKFQYQLGLWEVTSSVALRGTLSANYRVSRHSLQKAKALASEIEAQADAEIRWYKKFEDKIFTFEWTVEGTENSRLVKDTYLYPELNVDSTRFALYWHRDLDHVFHRAPEYQLQQSIFDKKLAKYWEWSQPQPSVGKTLSGRLIVSGKAMFDTAYDGNAPHRNRPQFSFHFRNWEGYRTDGAILHTIRFTGDELLDGSTIKEASDRWKTNFLVKVTSESK